MTDRSEVLWPESRITTNNELAYMSHNHSGGASISTCAGILKSTEGCVWRKSVSLGHEALPAVTWSRFLPRAAKANTELPARAPAFSFPRNERERERKRVDRQQKQAKRETAFHSDTD